MPENDVVAEAIEVCRVKLEEFEKLPNVVAGTVTIAKKTPNLRKGKGHDYDFVTRLKRFRAERNLYDFISDLYFELLSGQWKLKCVECGRPIPIKRFEATPTNMCVVCKEALEKRIS